MYRDFARGNPSENMNYRSAGGMEQGYNRSVGPNFSTPSYTSSRAQPQSEFMSHSVNPNPGFYNPSQRMQQPFQTAGGTHMASSLPTTGVDPKKLPPVEDLPKKLLKSEFRPGNNLPDRNFGGFYKSGVVASGNDGYHDSAWQGRHGRSGSVNDSPQSLAERYSTPARGHTFNPIQRSKTDMPYRNSEPTGMLDGLFGGISRKAAKPKKEGFITTLAKAIFARQFKRGKFDDELSNRRHSYISPEGQFEVVEAMIRVQRMNPMTRTFEPFHDEGLFTTLKIRKNPYFALGLMPNEKFASFLTRIGLDFDSIIDSPTKSYIKGVAGVKPEDNIRLELLSQQFLSHGTTMEIGGVFQSGQHFVGQPSYTGTPSRGQYMSEFSQRNFPEHQHRDYSGRAGNYDHNVMEGGQEVPKKGVKQKVKEAYSGVKNALKGEGHGPMDFSERKGEHYMGHEGQIDNKRHMRVIKKLEPEFTSERKHDHHSERPMKVSKRRVYEEEEYYTEENGQDQHYGRDGRIGQGGYYDKGHANQGGYFDKGNVRTNEAMYGYM